MSPSPHAPGARLLGGRRWLWMLGFMAAGALLRVAWFSGFGLGDDFIFRNEVNTILVGRTVLPDNQAYRFTWWFPVALSCRLLGLTEAGLVLPFTATATLGIGLVYALGAALYGPAGAAIAALLLLVHPLDFVWSTMLTNDIMASVTAAATVLLALRALEQDDQTWRRRLWTWAGVTLWLAVHAKLSGVFLVPIVALICVAHRARLTRDVAWMVLAAGSLLAFSLTFSYVFTGDPLFAYHAEVSFQGLSGPGAAQHRVFAETFWTYPRILFQRDHLGDFVYGGQPQALVLLLVLAPLLGLRTSSAAFWWFVWMFVGMELNVQRAEGVWVAGFRNIRHTHVFVYPLVLMLAGLFASLRARLPRLTYALLAALLAFSFWQSVGTASRTRVAFGDRRAACRYLAALPRATVHADEGLNVYCAFLTLPGGPLATRTLHPNPEPRRLELAGVTDGYTVTGGSREPYYGCPHCIPRMADLEPGKWQLLAELPGPAEVTPWRPEPLRIWQVAGGRPAPR